uniref:Uncharacterized protein n=1 Tax=Marseillevirus LCMAC202 TaxID=2506606 RepID=A0A481YZL3_9VIRU|nr:MAG: hypothetical protein LCMAC202_06090 [Marseillevirus LCMAC202]
MLMARKSSKRSSRKSSKKGSRKISRRKLSDWQKYVKAHKGQGLTLKKLGAEYRKVSKKRSRRKASKKRSRRKASKKRSRKVSKKRSRKVSKKRSRKVSKKRSRRKASKKRSRKVSKKRSRKVSRRAQKGACPINLQKEYFTIDGAEYYCISNQRYFQIKLQASKQHPHGIILRDLREKISANSVHELKTIAQYLGLKKYSKLRKTKLVGAIIDSEGKVKKN